MPLYKNILLFSLLFLNFKNVSSQHQEDFLKIYNNIISTQCALAGCHDGNFEPNFTSLMSSYNTLVYHPIIKNNRDKTFEYRVVPFNYKKSILYERITNCCFVDNDDRMPFYDKEGLKKEEIELIKNWINGGALAIDGNSPKFLSTIPNIEGITIFQIDNNNKTKLEEMLKNSLGETIGYFLKQESSYEIVIYLKKENIIDEKILENFYLSIILEDKEIKKEQLKYSSENQTLTVKKSFDYLNKQNLYTFQLKNNQLISFAFPNPSTSYYLSVFWNFQIQ